MTAAIGQSRVAGLTRVLCVDDNQEMTSAMRMLINSDPTMRCVGCLHSANELSREVAGMDPAPDVLMLDATMPGKDPLGEMKKLAAEFPGIRTIVLSGHDDEAFVSRVKSSGAWGFVSKSDEPQFMLHAVTRVAAGNIWFPDARRGG